MTNVQLSKYVDLLILPSGRATWAMKHVMPEVAAARDGRIGPQAEVVLSAAQKTRAMELDYRGPHPKKRHGPGAVAADGRVDRTLGGLAKALQSTLDSFDAKHPRAVAAARLEEELFPRGVGAVTGMKFIEQHETINILLGRLNKGGDLAGEIALLALEPLVARLGEVNSAFGKELGGKPSDRPSWDEVRAARKKMHAEMVKLVALVCGAYPDDDLDHVTMRTRLLGPIAEQEELVTQRRRGRGAVTDVDPETGEETEPLVDSDDPVPAPV